MDKIILLLRRRAVKIVLHVLSIPCLLFLGWLIGHTVQLKLQQNEISNLKAAYDTQIAGMKEELDAVINNQGQLVETANKNYVKEQASVYSPLLDGKKMDVLTYKYKGHTIVRKRIEINEHSGVEMWEYTSNDYDISQGPKDFAIFGGYENNTNTPLLVDDIKKNWTDTYTTKKGITMYYEYETTPKNIGVVLLDYYSNHLPNYKYSEPTLIQIWFNNIEGFPSSKDDPFVVAAKKELNGIADSFELVQPPRE